MMLDEKISQIAQIRIIVFILALVLTFVEKNSYRFGRRREWSRREMPLVRVCPKTTGQGKHEMRVGGPLKTVNALGRILHIRH